MTTASDHYHPPGHDHDHDHDHPHSHAPSESVAALEQDLKLASTILEWESGDIFGHVGVRLPGGDGIACKLFRYCGLTPEDWLVHFDFTGKKLSGVGTPPAEYAIYTEVLRRRPDVQAIVHSHAPACVAMSLADKPITTIHMQSAKFGAGVPIYPRPIHIKDQDEGSDLAQMLADGRAIIIKGHGVVTVGRSIDEATMNALYLERTAKIQGLAMALGFTGPTREFVAEIQESSRKQQAMGTVEERHRLRGGYSNEWAYYTNKIRAGERWTRGWS
jgi:ribulose-5-phosphate 4-epimerase/fuculose-1-phosphate aldolase